MIIAWVTRLSSLRGKYFPVCLEQQKEEKKNDLIVISKSVSRREIKRELWDILHKAKSSIKLTS